MVNSEKYYSLSGKNAKQGACAFSPKNLPVGKDLISELEGKNQLPFEFKLKKISFDKTGLIESDDLSALAEVWVDYMPSDLFPSFSKKVKDIIQENLSGEEHLDWIEAKLNGNGEQRIYYIPRFNKKLDVLDFEKSTFISKPDHVLIPSYSYEKIKNLGMFCSPSIENLWKITTSLYVSEVIKKAIQKAKLTGIVFEQTRVS